MLGIDCRGRQVSWEDLHTFLTAAEPAGGVSYRLVLCESCVVVQSLSFVWLFETPWTAACRVSLSFPISQSLLKLMSIESVMPSSHLVLCHPPLLLPSIFPSIRVLSNESALNIMWPKYWCFSLSISPSNKYSGLISLVQEWELCPKEKSSLWEDRRPFNKQRKPLLVCDKILDLLRVFFFF